MTGATSERTEAGAFLRITEIFHSIQGESTWAGRPCTFVRLTGCPLRCTWCDTEYAFHGGERLSLDDIVERVGAIGEALVEVTGGEPLAHPGAFELVDRLIAAGHTVLVETSGAFEIEPLAAEAHVIMDLKCPGSGEVERNLWSNLDHLDGRDEIKFVVSDREDYEWMRDVVVEKGLGARLGEGSLRALLVSPVWNVSDEALRTPQGGNRFLEELSQWILDDRLPVRLQVQLHKLIWGPHVAGV